MWRSLADIAKLSALSFGPAAALSAAAFFLSGVLCQPIAPDEISIGTQDILLVALFSPLIETLVLAILYSLFRWLGIPHSFVILLVGIIFGALHFAARGMVSGIASTWSFTIFSYAFGRGRLISLSRGFTYALFVHIFHNSYGLLIAWAA